MEARRCRSAGRAESPHPEHVQGHARRLAGMGRPRTDRDRPASRGPYRRPGSLQRLRLRGLLVLALVVTLVITLFTISPRDLVTTIGLIALVALPLAWSVAALLDAARRPEWV